MKQNHPHKHKRPSKRKVPKPKSNNKQNRSGHNMHQRNTLQKRLTMLNNRLQLSRQQHAIHRKR